MCVCLLLFITVAQLKRYYNSLIWPSGHFLVHVCVFHLQCDSVWAMERDNRGRIQSEQSAGLLHAHAVWTFQLQPYAVNHTLQCYRDVLFIGKSFLGCFPFFKLSFLSQKKLKNETCQKRPFTHTFCIVL